MPYRREGFFKGEFYHVFNRVSKGNVLFHSNGDYLFFLRLIESCLRVHPLRIVCYCLMPNHFHFLLSPLIDGSVSGFISLLLNTYVKSIQKKYGETGRLFPNRFKHVHVENDAQLIHLMRYIHLNPLKTGFVLHPSEWPYSNYWEFTTPGSLGKRRFEFVVAHFRNAKEYEDFVMDSVVDESTGTGFERFYLE